MGTEDKTTTKQNIYRKLSSFERKTENSIKEDFAVRAIKIAVSLNVPIVDKEEPAQRLKTLCRLMDILGFRTDTDQCAKSTDTIRRRWGEDTDTLYSMHKIGGNVSADLIQFLTTFLFQENTNAVNKRIRRNSEYLARNTN